MRLWNRGFTLIEVMMVVLIMAIAAIAVPMSLSRSSETVNVPSATRMVMADVAYGQSVATTQQRRVFVVPSKSGSVFTGYDLALDTTSPSAATDYVTTSDRGRWTTRFGNAGNGQTAPGALRSTQLLTIRLEDADGNVTQNPLAGICGFDAQGRPIIDNSGTVTTADKFVAFVVTNQKGDVTYKVRIAPITGDISMR